MANESKTESLVRKMLKERGYHDNETIKVEEQSSENKRISDLLSKASKSGSGRKGHPEFIVSFFIKYAGSDKKIGTVLTPPHITEFFCDVAELDSKDIVFDPCCGTGGFLVSAMNYMMRKAPHDTEKGKHIRSYQLFRCRKTSRHVCACLLEYDDAGRR